MKATKILFLVMISLLVLKVQSETIENFVDNAFAQKYIDQKKQIGRLKFKTLDSVDLNRENIQEFDSLKGVLEIDSNLIEIIGQPQYRSSDNSFEIVWREINFNNENGPIKEGIRIDHELKSFIRINDDQIEPDEELWVVGETNQFALLLDQISQETKTQETINQSADIESEKKNLQSVEGGDNQDQPIETAEPVVEIKEDPETGLTTYKRFCNPRFNLDTQTGYFRIATLEVPTAKINEMSEEILTFTNSLDESSCRDANNADGAGLDPYGLEVAIGNPCLAKNPDFENKKIDLGFRLTFDKGFSAVDSDNSSSSQGRCFYDDDGLSVSSNSANQFANIIQVVNGNCQIREDLANNRVDRGYIWQLETDQSINIDSNAFNQMSQCKYDNWGDGNEDDLGNPRFFEVIKEYKGDEGSQSTCATVIDTENGIAIDTFDVVYYDQDQQRRALYSCVQGNF